MTPRNSNIAFLEQTPPAKPRVASKGDSPIALADIYRESVNMTVWQRELSREVQAAASDFSASNNSFTSAINVTPAGALSCVAESLRAEASCVLVKDIAELVDMFCCLLGLERAGLRMSVLTRAMCPKFHVDRVPCRLITTYQGPGTEWLRDNVVDRSKLGTGSSGQSDLESGLFKSVHDVERLKIGDVALLKGELWEGNEDAGLVHRSPALETGVTRLLVTIDVSR